MIRLASAHRGAWLLLLLTLMSSGAYAKKAARCINFKTKAECVKHSACAWSSKACAKATKTAAKPKASPSQPPPGAEADDPAAPDNAAGDEDF